MTIDVAAMTPHSHCRRLVSRLLDAISALPFKASTLAFQSAIGTHQVCQIAVVFLKMRTIEATHAMDTRA